MPQIKRLTKDLTVSISCSFQYHCVSTTSLSTYSVVGSQGKQQNSLYKLNRTLNLKYEIYKYTRNIFSTYFNYQVTITDNNEFVVGQ